MAISSPPERDGHGQDRTRRIATPLVAGLQLIALVVVVGACTLVGSSPIRAIATPSPSVIPFATRTPTPSASPNVTHSRSSASLASVLPTPTPIPWPTDDQLAELCGHGTPIPEAAPYGGHVHPLVVGIDDGLGGPWEFDVGVNKINQKAWPNSWLSPIQLVV